MVSEFSLVCRQPTCVFTFPIYSQTTQMVSKKCLNTLIYYILTFYLMRRSTPL